MPIKYRTTQYRNDIQAFEVIKESKHFITFKNHVRGTEEREARSCEYQQWFDTWEQAQAHLFSRERQKQRMYRIKLEEVECAIAEIRKLEPAQNDTKWLKRNVCINTQTV